MGSNENEGRWSHRTKSVSEEVSLGISSLEQVQSACYNKAATTIIAIPAAPTVAPFKLDAAPMKFAGRVDAGFAPVAAAVFAAGATRLEPPAPVASTAVELLVS